MVLPLLSLLYHYRYNIFRYHTIRDGKFQRKIAKAKISLPIANYIQNQYNKEQDIPQFYQK